MGANLVSSEVILHIRLLLFFFGVMVNNPSISACLTDLEIEYDRIVSRHGHSHASFKEASLSSDTSKQMKYPCEPMGFTEPTWGFQRPTWK